MSYNLLSRVRISIWQLQALNADGSLYMDVSSRLIKAEATFSDQLESHKITLTLSSDNSYQDGGNGDPFFDVLGSGAGSDVFISGRLIKFRKGFYDGITGQSQMWDAFTGTVTDTEVVYERDKPMQIVVTCFDLMYPLLTIEATTQEYVNCQTNIIAAAILQEFAGITNLNLYPLDQALPQVQFPAFTVADALSDLYLTSLYWCRFDYSGVFTTSPRVGSGASGAPNLIGWPDATEPPPSDLVSFVFPDGQLIAMQESAERLFTFDNQIRILGQALTETITYGPVTLLTQVGDTANVNFLPSRQGKLYNLQLSQATNEQNILTARGVFVQVYDPSFAETGTPGGLKTLCADPNAVDVSGNPVPLGPWETHNQDINLTYGTGAAPSICSFKTSGVAEGMIFLLVNLGNPPVNPPSGGVGVVTSWTVVPLSLYANSDGGGYEYAIFVYGQPVIVSNAILTAFIDYNSTPLTGVSCTDIFGDHRTYQILDTDSIPVIPIAMGTPLEIFVNGPLASSTLAAPAVANTTGVGTQTIQLTSASGPPAFTVPPSAAAGGLSGMNTIRIVDGANSEYNTISSIEGDVLTLGTPLLYNHAAGCVVYGITVVLTADGLNASPYAKVSWEQGQIIFTDMTYDNYLEDDDASHPYSTGGESINVPTDYPGVTFDLTRVVNPCPVEVYNTYRQTTVNAPTPVEQSFFYSIAGLTPGLGYQMRLHFANPWATGVAQCVFFILFNGIVQNGGDAIDLWSEQGGTQIAVALNYDGVTCDDSGNLVIEFANGGGLGGDGTAMCSAIELIDPTGASGALPIINCGGPAINPTPPVITCNTGYSPDQRERGLKSTTVDNPLLSTLAQCLAVGGWFQNATAWQRNPIKLTFADIPTIECGQIVEFTLPLPNASLGGSRYWVYIQSLTRTMERTDKGATDLCEANCFLLFVQPVN